MCFMYESPLGGAVIYDYVYAVLVADSAVLWLKLCQMPS